MSETQKLLVTCKYCRRDILFDQPYAYHAGFADQGFLYNDAGTLTLVWSILDPVIEQLFPGQPAWSLNPLNRWRFQGLLLPAPVGGLWRFRNPARCVYCGKPVSKPMLHSIHYLVYPGSIFTDRGEQPGLGKYLKTNS